MTQAVAESDGLHVRPGFWTAQRALAGLSETSEMVIEVIAGSLVVSPCPAIDHQAALAELVTQMRPVARAAGYRAYPQINLKVGDELTIPDFAVIRPSEGRRTWVDAGDVLLVVEIMSPGGRRKDRIKRLPIYVDAGIPYYMRIEFRGDDPAILLHELIDGEYELVAVGTAGSTFQMTKPFAFEIDPADLRDD